MDGIAATALFKAGSWLDPHFLLLMKQPPDNLFQRQCRISQFYIGYGTREDRDMLPFGMVHPHMQPLPPFFAVGRADR